MFNKIIFLFVCSLFAINVKAQINESENNSVYSYLYRMAQKGVVSLDNYILPLDRTTIFQALQDVQQKDTLLTKVEKNELKFYLIEYSIDNILAEDTLSNIDIFKKDNYTRFRTFNYKQKDFLIAIDPYLGVQQQLTSRGNNIVLFNGFRVIGKLSKNIGFSFLFRDVNELGDTIDVRRTFNNNKGVILGSVGNKSISYSELNFNIGYKFKNGLLSIGKENLVVGYGNDGNLILSAKSPSYPYIRLDFKPTKWLHFNYMHAWLSSDVIDSSRIYNTGSGVFGSIRDIYAPKFFATHSITIKPTKKLELTIGESIVYSDRFDIGFLMPINFFKSYDHLISAQNINAGSNAQFFFQFSSKNHIKNTHIYSQLFIDEIRLLKVFNKQEQRNQLGYLLGVNVTDIGLKYLSVGFEYTRINPFVYNNLVPAQTYANSGFALGNWMGNNADRINLFFSYTPIARLKINGSYQYIRKGGAGNIQQQYLQQPQPSFLFDYLFNQQQLNLTATYEWIHSLKSFVVYKLLQTNNSINKQTDTQFSVGFSYGL